MFRLPEAFESHATTGGLIGASVAILCLLALGWMYAQGNLARREAVAIAFSAATGVFIGFAARMLTAGGIGANIGGGLVIMLGISGLVGFVFTSRRDRSQA